MSNAFALDSRLLNDTIKLGETSLNLYLLMNDSQDPWVIMVPKIANMAELYELEEKDYITVQEESRTLARTMMDLFNGYKMNVAALGNVVRQLHIHHIVREEEDEAWPAPVWGASPAIAYTEHELEKTSSSIRKALASNITGFN